MVTPTELALDKPSAQVLEGALMCLDVRLANFPSCFNDYRFAAIKRDGEFSFTKP
jgi:hypothetical protein